MSQTLDPEQNKDKIREAMTLERLNEAYAMVYEAFGVDPNGSAWSDYVWRDCDEAFYRHNDASEVLIDIEEEQTTDRLFNDTDDEAFDGLNEAQARRALALAEFRESRADAIDVFAEVRGETPDDFCKRTVDDRLHDELIRRCNTETLNAVYEYEDL